MKIKDKKRRDIKRNTKQSMRERFLIQRERERERQRQRVIERESVY